MNLQITKCVALAQSRLSDLTDLSGCLSNTEVQAETILMNQQLIDAGRLAYFCRSIVNRAITLHAQAVELQAIARYHQRQFDSQAND
jgi:hypothetical protein